VRCGLAWRGVSCRVAVWRGMSCRGVACRVVVWRGGFCGRGRRHFKPWSDGSMRKYVYCRFKSP
jgi:hypothetical protein